MVRRRVVDGDARAFWDDSHVVGVGGSTLHYAAESHRMHPRAMQLRTLHGVAVDWPLDYGTLEPYYLQAERLIGVAGPEASLAASKDRPRSAPYPLPAHALSYASQRLGQGCAALGLSWTPKTPSPSYRAPTMAARRATTAAAAAAAALTRTTPAASSLGEHRFNGSNDLIRLVHRHRTACAYIGINARYQRIFEIFRMIVLGLEGKGHFSNAHSRR